MTEIMGYRLGMGIIKWQMKKKLCEWVREISLEEVRFRLGSKRHQKCGQVSEGRVEISKEINDLKKGTEQSI